MTNTPAPPRALGVLLIAEALLAFAPLAVLAPALGWPASLRLPAAEQMAAIAAAPGAVTLGYGLYLLYSLLVAPALVGMAGRAFGTFNHPGALTVVVFAALSALARAIGILRWLTLMPSLAAAHAQADAATQTTLALLFDAINRFGGGIGEVLGVSLLMAAALATLAVGSRRSGLLPPLLAWGALLCAWLLAGLSLPVFGVAVQVPVALAVTSLSVWMLAAGVWCLRRPRLSSPA